MCAIYVTPNIRLHWYTLKTALNMFCKTKCFIIGPPLKWRIWSHYCAIYVTPSSDVCDINWNTHQSDMYEIYATPNTIFLLHWCTLRSLWTCFVKKIEWRMWYTRWYICVWYYYSITYINIYTYVNVFYLKIIYIHYLIIFAGSTIIFCGFCVQVTQYDEIDMG